MFLQKIRQKMLGQPNLGLKPLSTDYRDVLGWRLFGADYEPKHKKKEINNPFPAKHQEYNTCGWTASAGAKQIDEKCELDERAFVIIGKSLNYISGDGFSNLRDNEKALQKIGIPEKGLITAPFRNWEEYSNTKLLTKEVLENAAKHKSKLFIKLNSIAEVYKAIDDERPVKIGIDWRTKFNMYGGFSFPWILNFLIGWVVGGHASYTYIYDLKYHGNKVFGCRNTYGETYGDKGNFYIKEKDLERCIRKYGAFRNEDMDIDLYDWLVNHQGKVVKTSDNPDVFLVQGDKKRPYADMSTLIAHGKSSSDIIVVQNEYLDNVKEGDKILFWDGGNVKQVKEFARIIKDNNQEIIKEFKNYFNDLWM